MADPALQPDAIVVGSGATGGVAAMVLAEAGLKPRVASGVRHDLALLQGPYLDLLASRFTGGRNGFEYLLAYLGIRQKNGTPGHPQTQGNIERFHQTLKRWLGRGPAARARC